MCILMLALRVADPHPENSVGSESGDFGRIRVRRIRLDPNPDNSIGSESGEFDGSESENFGGIRIRRIWLDPSLRFRSDPNPDQVLVFPNGWIHCNYF